MSVPERSVILRVDGKNFSRLTREWKDQYEQYNRIIGESMLRAATALVTEIPGVVVGYTVSDEISILLDLDKDPWYNARPEKMLSISASIASVHFHKGICATGWYFDSKIVQENGTLADVRSYFLSRRANGFSNAVSSYASSALGHKQIHGKSVEENLKSLEEARVEVDDRLSKGYWLYKYQREEDVVYTHKKTGEISRAHVIRNRWGSELALTYDRLSATLEA